MHLSRAQTRPHTTQALKFQISKSRLQIIHHTLHGNLLVSRVLNSCTRNSETQEYLESAYGEMPSFVDPEGLVVSPDDSEPAELCPGGARRRLVVEEGCVQDYVSRLVDLWLSLGVQMQMEVRLLPFLVRQI